MGTCPTCDALQNEKTILYEDPLAAVILPQKVSVPGHVLVVPKQHITILEEVPDEVLVRCFLVANKTLMLLFDSLGATGTNMIVHNGLPAGQTIPHFGIHLLPRKQEDGISFQWPQQKIPDQKMNDAHQALKDECDYIGHPPEEKKKEQEKPKENKKMEYREDNYLLRQLRRIP